MMDFGIASYGVGFLAGLVSTLSPCVLPILPIILGSALAAHRWAPIALATGLALSYAVIGTALAWASASLGLETSTFRFVGAGVVATLGLVLVSAPLQRRFATATAGLGNAGNTFVSRLALDGVRGQFVVGLALGIIWSPCVGPTLGTAIVLASRGSQLGQVALLMGVFGLGAALPVGTIAYLSRGAMNRARGRLLDLGKQGKTLMGGVMLVVAFLILSGLDRTVEGWLVQASPDWLTALTTRF